MKILQTLKTKIGFSTFSGAEAKEILAAVRREMQKRQKILLHSIQVPDSFQIELGSADFAAIKPFQDIFTHELTQATREYVTTQKYTTNTGDIQVELCCNPSHAEGTISVYSTFSSIAGAAKQDNEERSDKATVKLIIAAGDSHEEIRMLGTGIHLIGRGRDADIFPLVEDMHMSRSHCLLTIEANSILLQDLNSGNGICVNNGAPVAITHLQSGDCFLCGNTTFCIQP